jgi:hypothetical protein
VLRLRAVVLAGVCASILPGLPGLAAVAAGQDLAPQAVSTPHAATRDDEGDHALVLELGAAGDWSPSEGFRPGGTFAFEVTPIEHWLELEVGFTAIRADQGTEMPIDVLFKKPWRFSPQFEFMVGIGPEFVLSSAPNGANFWGVSSVVDLMFWPRQNVGWYVEPGYEVTFRDGTTRHGFGISGGLLIGR